MPLLRSVLFTPGSNKQAIQKARTLPCDAVILDLEDSIIPDHKVAAREIAKDATLKGGFGFRELAVRINGLDTEWFYDDIKMFSDSAVNRIVVPKAEDPEAIRKLVKTMFNLGYSMQNTSLWLMLETPTGILNSRYLAEAHPSVDTLLMGTSDLSKNLQVPSDSNRTGLIHLLSQCVLVARAHKCNIIDGIFPNLENQRAYRAECSQGRLLGFDGKTLIHPSQIHYANLIFSPSSEDIANAEAVVRVWNKASSEGKGVCIYNGRLIERLHVDEAKRLISVAQEIACR